ncbi:MAG TPA: glycosyltransferase [Kiritimatiellia bacterium]|nr:glycosyltransferase [Kiritimatiellia bacterium]HMO99342.1 glycosyltransferase [Kiritimatiellia bacterium]HMP97436.1 glycosyltransferase [Kiritimatiellia bacterium]
MIQGFLDEGYAVDVIHWTRRQPLPRLDYDIYVDVRRNFDRYAAALPASCLKIAHMDTAHHTVHNGNQRRRLAELQARRGIALDPFKLIEENQAAEHADLITVLGNTFTIESFAFAQKPITRIRLSNAFTYPFPESKDFHSARSRFLWMGSEGFVHKGLDLVLEAFDGMPNRELIVCGPIDREPAFRKAFADLLYRRPNIKTPGWVDVAGPAFKHIAESCIGLVYPSCSEGGGGCVITAMHAGLIPIVTREASVDVEPSCGMLLPDASVAGIRQAVSDVAEKPEAECAGMARAAWSWARENHTRERFRHEYRAFVRSLADRLEAKRAT